MDDDTEVINSKDNYPSRTFYDSSRCIPKPNVRRQTRHAASDVGFRLDRDLLRIPENDNARRKRRTKPQHCPSYLSQSLHNHSMDSRPYDQHRRKNLEKPEAHLIQHVDYATTKMSRSHGKNRSVHRQGSPMSPRASSAHRRSQHHRPGTSHNRNNPDNGTGHRLVRKHGNIDTCECSRLDSPLRDVVNSDGPTEDTDFQLPCEHMHSRNICRECDLYWHSPPGEPHSEPELDSPPQDRYRDYTESKKRLAGQGANSYDNCKALEAKVSIESGSSVDNDVREQYERDRQVLKGLYEDVGEFEKRKSAGWGANGLHEEKYAWVHPKQQREEEDDELDDSRYLLESINQLVEKLPAHRKGNPSRVVTALSAKAKLSSKTQKERSRAQNRKLDTRSPTYYSVEMDGRSGDQQREVGRNFDDKLASIQHPESLKREEEKEDEERILPVESLSETEEDARELAREERATKQIHRRLKKSWESCKRRSGPWKSRISGKEERATRGSTELDKDEETEGKPDCGKKEAATRERSKGKRRKEVMICEEESEPLKPNHSGANEAEHEDCKRTNTRGRSGENEKMADKMYEEFKNCYGVSEAHGAGDLELETSKTRTCIDEIIDGGLSREANRETLRTTAKDVLCEVDSSDASALPQKPVEGKSTNVRPEEPSSLLRTDEHIRAYRGDCFCKALAEIVTDYQGPQEYMNKLKNYRLAYLNNMQNDLEKLYSLEKYLDVCSLERHRSSVTLTTGFIPESKEPNNISEKRDKTKGSGTQSRP